MTDKYRIIQREFVNGIVKYVVEKYQARWDKPDWTSIYTASTLEKAREIVEERQGTAVKAEKVIE